MVFTLFLESEYTSHNSRFQAVMGQKNLCALLFACDPNPYYLSGYHLEWNALSRPCTLIIHLQSDPILNVYKEIKEEDI